MTFNAPKCGTLAGAQSRCWSMLNLGLTGQPLSITCGHRCANTIITRIQTLIMNLPHSALTCLSLIKVIQQHITLFQPTALLATSLLYASVFNIHHQLSDSSRGSKLYSNATSICYLLFSGQNLYCTETPLCILTTCAPRIFVSFSFFLVCMVK